MISMLLGGWKGYAALGLLALVIGTVQEVRVGWLKLSNANQKTYITALEGQRDRALERIDRDAVKISEMKATNEENLKALDEIERRYKLQVAVVAADRDRIKAEKAKVRVVRQVIHEQAQACNVPVPPALDAVRVWALDNRDVAPGAFGFNPNSPRREQGAGGDAVLRPGAAAPAPARP